MLNETKQRKLEKGTTLLQRETKRLSTTTWRQHDHTGTLHVYKEMLNKQRVKVEVHSINYFFLLFENDPCSFSP